MEENKKIRRRVNFSCSVKNVVDANVTCDIENGTEEEVMKEVKSLFEKADSYAKEKSV